MTDPERDPEPAEIISRLPRGTMVIFRHYGASDREALGRRLRAIALRRRLVFLVAGDWRLARRLGADGVHLPEWMVPRRPRFAPKSIAWTGPVTAAAHDNKSAHWARRANVDMILLSPVFPTPSHPERETLGNLGLAAAVRSVGLPALALGGIGPKQARRILQAGAAGIAGISGIPALAARPHGLSP